jgi:hypothetical protein
VTALQIGLVEGGAVEPGSSCNQRFFILEFPGSWFVESSPVTHLSLVEFPFQSFVNKGLTITPSVIEPP